MTPQALPHIPWEDRPKGTSDVVWRYSHNPIIPRDLIPSSNSIFNSAVVPFEDRFAGVFRCDNKKREMNIHRGFSQDGIDWEIENVYIDETSMQERGIKAEQIITIGEDEDTEEPVQPEILSSKAIQELMQQQDTILSF